MTQGFRLRIDLLDSDPPIWRRLTVPADITLDRLHHVLQAAMGWTNSHLHRFEGGTSDGETERYAVALGFMPDEDPDERGVPLARLLSEPGDSMLYEYDFGDSWEHLVTLESVEADGGIVCLDGAGACPPEDSGGIWNYNEMRPAYTDPSHPEHAELTEWLGGPFDPDRFDADEATRRLRRA